MLKTFTKGEKKLLKGLKMEYFQFIMMSVRSLEKKIKKMKKMKKMKKNKIKSNLIQTNLLNRHLIKKNYPQTMNCLKNILNLKNPFSLKFCTRQKMIKK